MRDTQKNIKEYKKQLKYIKEKLSTSILLFLMSAVMMTTASLAWIVLSTAPAVKGISTSVAGNGNLEIALATADEDGLLVEPNSSQVGDSNLALELKNLTWGNLINLGDPSYGLGNIVLRPATLNYTDTLTSPLYAMEYDLDGRIIQQNPYFSYGRYSEQENKFVMSDIPFYGVRSISSVEMKASDGAAQDNLKLMTEIDNALSIAKNDYLNNVVQDEENLSVISTMMGIFISDKLSSGASSDVTEYVPKVKEMLEDLHGSLTLLGEFYVDVVNVQIMKTTTTATNSYDLISLLKESESSLNSKKINLHPGFNQFKDDYNKVASLIVKMQKYIDDKTPVNFDMLQPDINYLVDIGSCVIDDQYKITDLDDNLGGAFGLLSGTHKGTITKGALKRFEQLTGAKMKSNVVISASGINVKATVQTDATEPYTLVELLRTEDDTVTTIEKIVLGSQTLIKTASDIYGMAIDLWFRTNIDDSYLLLEGKPEYVYEILENANGYYCYEDENGYIYYHIPDENFSAPSKVDDPTIEIEDKTYLSYGTFYNYTSNQPISFMEPVIDEETGEALKDDNDQIVYKLNAEKKASFIAELKYSLKTIITGYDGVNRVWEESELLIDGTSTTQGDGSCFIFYPEDPIEEARMLELLKAFTVAFINTNGEVLTTASLNSDEAFKEVGKVTVPLQLSNTSLSVYQNEEDILVITPLNKNEAMMITAVIFVDGNKITNADVDELGNIIGYLNLQFGSNIDLDGMDDEKLQSEYVNATATVSKSSFTSEDIPATTELTINIIGTEADEVKVNFVRQVNNFQGVLLDDLYLTKTSSGESSSSWFASKTFENPGTYILRNVWVDGVEYELENPVEITIEGFKIIDIQWGPKDAANYTSSEVYEMSSSYSYPIKVDAKLSSALEIKKVNAKFRNEYNEYVTIPLSDDGDSWNGVGNFTTSGTYTLEFLEVNGDIYAVQGPLQKIMHISLGIQADVELTPTSFKWDAENPKNNIVNITSVKIYDNNGKELEGLSNASLKYSISGSITNTLNAPLTWNETSKRYTGEFNVLTPGVYSFANITVQNGATQNTITSADAPGITAVSPYPLQFVEDSLFAPQYQFAPNNDAGFIVQMQDASTEYIVAKINYHKVLIDGSTELVTDYVKAVSEDYDASTRISTFKFKPYVRDEQGTLTSYQDGTWTIEEIYVTNVYYEDEIGEGKWYAKADEAEWWNVDEKTITWDLTGYPEAYPDSEYDEDYVARTISILSQVNVSATYDYGKDENGDVINQVNNVFTGSIAEKFYVHNFAIKYTNRYGTTIDNEYLSDYGIKINSNKVIYKYVPQEDVLTYWSTVTSDGVTSSGKDLINNHKNLINNKEILFTGTEDEKIIFKYPGTYTPSLTINITNGLDTKDYLIGSATTYDNFLKVSSTISKQEKVEWKLPQVNWHSISPDDTQDIYYGINYYKISGGSWALTHVYGIKATNKTKNEISIDENYINVFIRLMDGDTEWSDDYVKQVEYGRITNNFKSFPYLVATTAKAQLENAGNFSSAICVIDDKNKNDLTFEFTPQNLIIEKTIGKGSTKQSVDVSEANNSLVNPVAKNSKAENVTITLSDGSVYVFKLEKPLTVNPNNSSGW